MTQDKKKRKPRARRGGDARPDASANVGTSASGALPASQSRYAREEQEETFCRAYAAWNNATRAAVYAGYAEGSAHVTGSRLLRRDKIRDRVREIAEERRARLDVEGDEIAGILMGMLRTNIDDVMDLQTGIVRADAGREAMATVVSVKIKQIPTSAGIGEERTVEIADKTSVAKLLMQKLGLLSPERIALEGVDGAPVALSLSVMRDVEIPPGTMPDGMAGSAARPAGD
ncbi:MAG: terminase small subunit [Christensenellaceae bacterium]|nr:terminase small subunit [Christensenellaceae bacterium]